MGTCLPLCREVRYNNGQKTRQFLSQDCLVILSITQCYIVLHSTIPLKQDSSVEMKLLDDAFIKICDMVNDSAVGVRALSAGLLGDFHAASSKFLDQTLDKKLMSHLKVDRHTPSLPPQFLHPS